MSRGRGTRWKAVKLDWSVIETYREDECLVCLTPRQAAALLGYMRGMEWRTRWDNLPADIDLQGFVDDIQGRLIDVACNDDTSLRECICNLTATIQQQLNLRIALDVIQPDIPPDNPGLNYPQITSTDGPVADRRDAYLCDLSKAWSDTMFEMLYRSSVEYCENQQDARTINWGRVAAGAVAIAAALALGPGGGIASASLFAAALSAGGLAIGPEIEEYVLASSSAGDCSSLSRVSDAVVDAYGCQLFNAVWRDINYSNFRGAYDAQSADTIAALVADGMTTSEAVTFDGLIRPLLAAFMTGDAFQAFIESVATAADNLYYEGAICEDCITVDPTPIDITSWVDPRILAITPPPTITGTGDVLATWPGGGWDDVVIVFDDAYSVDDLRCEIVRSVTASQPSAIEYQINTLIDVATFGGFGVNDEVLNFKDQVARFIRIRPGNIVSQSRELKLRFTGPSPRIRLRTVT